MLFAVVLELAYRLDLKSSALWDCGFKSRLPHQKGTELRMSFSPFCVSVFMLTKFFAD